MFPGHRYLLEIPCEHAGQKWPEYLVCFRIDGAGNYTSLHGSPHGLKCWVNITESEFIAAFIKTISSWNPEWPFFAQSRRSIRNRGGSVRTDILLNTIVFDRTQKASQNGVYGIELKEDCSVLDFGSFKEARIPLPIFAEGVVSFFVGLETPIIPLGDFSAESTLATFEMDWKKFSERWVK
ncbi:MAG: hypothetical protein RLZZ347_501 [Candidatus Parcubacteria bacterium]|jgi:hypothetical protein